MWTLGESEVWRMGRRVSSEIKLPGSWGWEAPWLGWGIHSVDKAKQKDSISIFPNHKRVSHREGRAKERKRRQQNRHQEATDV